MKEEKIFLEVFYEIITLFELMIFCQIKINATNIRKIYQLFFKNNLNQTQFERKRKAKKFFKK